MIGPFNGKYKFLCNFYRYSVTMDGASYPTVEHAYQAAKLTSEEDRRIVREIMTRPGSAKRYARSKPCREDWFNINLSVMRGLLRQKFAPGSDLAHRLDETGDEELVEVNHWGDTFWGALRERGTLMGKNHLGKMLMAIRDENR